MLNGIVGAFSVIFFKVYDPDEGKRALILEREYPHLRLQT